MQLASAAVVGLRNELRAAWHHEAAKHRLNAGARQSDDLFEVEVRAELVQIICERDAHVVVLHLSGAALDERRDARQFGFDELHTGLLELAECEIGEPLDLRIEPLEPSIAHHAEPKSAQVRRADGS